MSGVFSDIPLSEWVAPGLSGKLLSERAAYTTGVIVDVAGGRGI